MYKMTINQEGYDAPFILSTDWRVGQFIGGVLPTFGGKLTVTVELMEDKKEEEEE